MVELKEPLATLWRGKDAFAEVKKLNGEVFRELETRRTLRFELSGKSYFLKWHKGTTLKEIIKNLLSLRMPVLGADREWHAIHRLSDVGVDTMKGIGFGEKGLNPLTRASFIITEDRSAHREYLPLVLVLPAFHQRKAISEYRLSPPANRRYRIV